MTTTTSTHLDVRPIAGSLGAEIHGVDLRSTVSDELLAAIKAALLEHLVVFFPGQHLAPAQHREFASRWGEMEIHPFIPKVEGFPEVVELKASGGYVADVWHTDVTFSAR